MATAEIPPRANDSTGPLSELLSGLSLATSPEAAAALAAGFAAEALAADVAAVVSGDSVVSWIGPPEEKAKAGLAAAATGGTRQRLAGIGDVTLARVTIEFGPDTRLVVARATERRFTVDEERLLADVAAALKLTLRLLRTGPGHSPQPGHAPDEAREAERALYRGELRLRAILDSAHEAFVSLDAEGLILDWNAVAELTFGWKRSEAIGRRLTELIAPRDGDGERRGFDDLVACAGADGRPHKTELQVLHHGRLEFPVELTLSRRDAGGSHVFHVFARDLTKEREAEHRRRRLEQLAQHAQHDPRTGLPNRALLLSCLDQALALAQSSRSTVALLLVDIDNLGLVNESLGHPAGDELLIAVSRRLRQALRRRDMSRAAEEPATAHLSGDTFAIVASGIDDEREAVELAECLSAALSAPLDVSGERLFVTLSVGIATAGEEGGAAALLRDADAALHRAKALGGARHEVFELGMRARALDRLHAESQLREAIERDQLRLLYQPIVSLTDGGLVGGEALIRWQHPERGLLSPVEFLHLAEATGMIIPVGRWVLEQACEQAAAWHADGHSLRVSVNLSAHQFARPELVPLISGLLAKTGLPPSRLGLEITESVLIAEMDSSAEILRELRSLGLRILLDDFGTGYSSLSYLRRLPLDAVKLDRLFIAQLGEVTADRQIVAAVVQMARALQMSVIAEGVESAEQLACLKELGCHYAQGFYFARPMTAERLTAALAHGSAAELSPAGSGRAAIAP